MIKNSDASDWWQKWRQTAKRLKRETYVLYYTCQDPRTPWYAKALTACVVGYAFSPIDLIPDFIPVLGYLDDLILLPLGVALILRCTPAAVIADCCERADRLIESGKPVNRMAAFVIVGIWLISALLMGYCLWKRLRTR